MEGKRLIRRLDLRNFLSYGGGGISIDLQPLNVLIGPNASGKSNLIEALAVLRATSKDLPAVFRAGGGVGEYLWKDIDLEESAQITAVIEYDEGDVDNESVLHYKLEFTDLGYQRGVTVVSEEVWQEDIRDDDGITMPAQVFYRYDEGKAKILQWAIDEDNQLLPFLREIRREDLAADQSVLSQRRDPEVYPEITHLSLQFFRIRIFQEWTFGQAAKARSPQRADLPSDFLLPDSSNLALVLNELLKRSSTRKRLLGYLQRFYQSARHISTSIEGGTVQLFIEEEGDKLVPATRLSDGTLRYLSLLAILCHPNPPPLICVEEPELGLHPDIIPTISELLRDAAQRTQLVVTTHSDTLVSALAETPECIVVCEPGPNGTSLRRLEAEALSDWLSRYSLGELWRMGELGGTRW